MTKVIYYTTVAKKNPALDFIKSLNEKQQRKIIHLLTTIQKYGLISVIPHIKKMAGIPLWEIRILGQDNVRFFYVTQIDDTILILHGFIKKSQLTPIKEIKAALGRLEEWNTRKNT